MTALITILLTTTAQAVECSEDAEQCFQLGNAVIERIGTRLYVECDSACAVGVSGDRISAITVTEGSAAIRLDHNIEEVLITGSDDSDILDASRSPVPAVIFGEAGPDTIIGTFLEDVLRGGYGNDTIDGLDGLDRIRGGQGNDTLIGGTGLDDIVGGRGADTCHGAATERQCEGAG